MPNSSNWLKLSSKGLKKKLLGDYQNIKSQSSFTVFTESGELGVWCPQSLHQWVSQNFWIYLKPPAGKNIYS